LPGVSSARASRYGTSSPAPAAAPIRSTCRRVDRLKSVTTSPRADCKPEAPALVYKDDRTQGGDQMKRFALLAAGLGAVVACIAWQTGAAQGQAASNRGLRLNLVGIAVSDYAKSQAFYERVMGFPIAFKFSSPDGTRTNTFFQMSRNSFLEMQQATADVRPGLTHAHFVVDDLTATLARLRQAGLATAPQNG